MSALRLAGFGTLCLLLMGAAPLPRKFDSLGMPLPKGAIARIGDPRFFSTNDSYVNALAWSPDGKSLASGGLRISIWDVRSAKVVRQLPGWQQPYTKALAWSSDGRLLASMNNDSRFTIHDVKTGKASWTQYRTPAGKHHGFLALRFLAKDRLLAIVTALRPGPAPRDSDEAMVRGWRVELWDVEKGTLSKAWTEDDLHGQLKELGDGYQVRYVALSPSGERMAWLATPPAKAKVNESVVLVRETASGKVLRTVKNLPRTYRTDLPDEGESLVVYPFRPEKVEKPITCQGVVVGMDGKVRYRFEYRFVPSVYENPYSDLVRGAGFIATEAARLRNSLVTTDEVGMVRWDWKTGKKQDEFNRPISALALSRDGRRLAISPGSGGRRIQISDGELAPLLTDDSFVRPPRIEFLPGGRMRVWENERSIAAEGGTRIWIRDLKRNVVLKHQYRHPWPAKMDLGAAEDDAAVTLVYRSGIDTNIVVRDLLANKDLCRLEGTGVGYSARMSGDGRRVLAYQNASPRRFIVRWFDARSGRELGRHEVENPKQGAVEGHFIPLTANWYSDDGSVFGYSLVEGSLTLVDTTRGKVTGTIRASRSDFLRHLGNQFVAQHPIQYNLKLHRHTSAALCTYWNHQGQVMRHFSVPADQYRLAATPDARLQPCQTERGEVVIYETITGRPRIRITLPRDVQDKLLYATLSHDGTLLATRQDNATVIVWDVNLVNPVKFTVPTSARQAAALWDLLGDPDPAKADPAIRGLMGAPKLAIGAMKGRLRPAATGDADLFDRPNVAPPCLREIRALEILERIGSAEAKRLVETVAVGHSGALLTREAKLVLGRWETR